MTTKKKPFPADTLRRTIPLIRCLGDSDMEFYVRRMFHNFQECRATDTQLYDFLASVATLPCDYLGNTTSGVRVGEGDISLYLRAVCDVKTHYERPAE